MRETDGRKVWPKSASLDQSQGVALLEGSSTNYVSAPNEVSFYAFFDSAEREDLKAEDSMFISQVRNKFHLSPEELLSARFDCVRADYFNKSLEIFRGFYATVREEDVEEPQDLQKEYWHDDKRTDQHTKLLADFFENDDNFRILFLVANRTQESQAFFEDVLRGERWIGLGVVPIKNYLFPPVVSLFTYNDFDYSSPEVMHLSSIWELTEQRINSLRHVFSLDFASDAHIPPPPKVPEPSGTPQLTGPLRSSYNKVRKARKHGVGLNLGPRQTVQFKPVKMRTGGSLLNKRALIQYGNEQLLGKILVI